MSKTKPRASTRFDAIVGAYIRHLRDERKLTQIHVAEDIGVSFQQLQKYESGANRLTVERFSQICATLDTNPAICLSEILTISQKEKALA